VSRITLLIAPGVPPIELSADYASYSETVEQVGKLKTFLRSQGWLALDERELE
jgi:hypothetical protein